MNAAGPIYFGGGGRSLEALVITCAYTHMRSPAECTSAGRVRRGYVMSDDKRACMSTLKELARCVEETPCFQSGKTFQQCLKEKDIGDCTVRSAGWGASSQFCALLLPLPPCSPLCASCSRITKGTITAAWARWTRARASGAICTRTPPPCQTGTSSAIGAPACVCHVFYLDTTYNETATSERRKGQGGDRGGCWGASELDFAPFLTGLVARSFML